MIRNHVVEMQDSAFEMIAYDFNRVISGKERTAEELLEQVDHITSKEVTDAAQTFHLNTVYFLKGEKGE
ncbi:hypothetical protein D3C85_1762380 [compost metagenome]